MTLDQIIELSHHAGVAVAIWIAIRSDLKWLLHSTRDHEKRIRLLERGHGPRHHTP
jgi:hypothetical protein